MKALSLALRNHFAGALTSLATCWKIIRKDGTVLGFTDHDSSLTIEGVKYEASTGYFRSAIANSATAAVDNLEVSGFLDSNSITELELRNGAFDFAEVEIFAVNWEDLSMGICRLRYGYFGEVNVRSSGLFTVELRGLMQLFSQTVVETIMPECRADLGDHRCGVPLVPKQRQSAVRYGPGDRVIVPDTPEFIEETAPVKNNRFDWYESDDYYYWDVENGLVTNFPDLPHSGAFYVRPTDTTGYARRILKVVPKDYQNYLGPGYPRLADMSLSFYANFAETGWEVSGTVELIKFEGVAGVVIEVITTLEIPYFYLFYQDPVHETLLNKWIKVEAGWDDINVEEAEAVRITLKWRPHNSHPNPQSPAPIRIDTPSYELSKYGEFIDPYIKFDALPQTSVGVVKEWGGAFLQTHPGNHNLMPAIGSFFLTSQYWTFPATTSISLVNDLVPTSVIDAGDAVFRFYASVGSFEWGAAAVVKFIFYDENDVPLETVNVPRFDIRPARMWHPFNYSVEIPPLSRRVRAELGASLTPEREGLAQYPSTAYDFASFSVAHKNADANDTFVLSGGVEFEALNEGISGSPVPAFNYGLGNQTVDGGVTWRAVAPIHSFLAQVTGVTDNSTFQVSGLDSPDNWFRWGVVTFLDGKNIGRGIECLEWDNATDTITLMFPTLMPIEVGDHIRIHAGCDKSRGISGCKKFNNILNFRGEPEVPGTDEYFKVGGSGR